jgi:cytochrome c oxidase subunit 2
MSRALALMTAAALAGCSGRLPVFDPAGPAAGRIAAHGWLQFWIAVIVVAGVLVVLLDTVRRRATVEAPLVERDAARERTLTIGVSVAVGLTAVALLVLLVASVATGRGLSTLGGEEPAVTIEVTARQWWWDVEYWDPVPAHRVRTANEIHVPVGKTVLLKLRSSDVIHSFWVPALQGKVDHIPGHTRSVTLKADRPGTFAGQCSEYCGLQHAHMRVLVIADPPEAFQAWLESQRRPASPPASVRAQRGRDVFMTRSCVLCHAIVGTEAGARTGPDLTHLASRATLAAGTLPNTPGHLAGWIVDPQSDKPGTRMPANDLGGDDLEALVEFLGELR